MLLLSGSLGEITHLALSPDGRWVAASGGDRGVEIWDAYTGELRESNWNPDEFSLWDGTVAFHPHRSRLFACSLEGLAVIDPDSMRIDVARPPVGMSAVGLMSFGLSADGNTVAHAFMNTPNGGAEVRVGRYTPGQRLGHVWQAALKPDGVKYRHTLVPSVRVSADGDTVTTLEQEFDDAPWRVRLVVRKADTGEIVRDTSPPGAQAAQTEVSPDGAWTVVRGGNHLFVTENADPIGCLGFTNTSRKHYTGIAFHPSGRYLAATSNDATVKLYDTATWTVAKAFAWDIGRLRSVAFSPDGTRAAVGSDSGKVLVWDVDL